MVAVANHIPVSLPGICCLHALFIIFFAEGVFKDCSSSDPNDTAVPHINYYHGCCGGPKYVTIDVYNSVANLFSCLRHTDCSGTMKYTPEVDSTCPYPIEFE